MLAFIVSRLLQSARRHAGGVVPVLRAVQLRGRPGEQHGGPGGDAGRARRDAPRARAGGFRGGPVRPLPGQRRHRQFRQELPPGPAGLRPDRRAHAGDARAGRRGGAARPLHGHPARRADGAAPPQARQRRHHDLLAGGRRHADLRDRHPADLCLLGGVQELGAGARPAGRLVLPLVRARRDGEARLVEHRPAHGVGPEGASCCRPSPSRCSR